ncbi:MAG: ABC transporter permease [Clostridia bacterium]|nr:ABC transporter permease [Clostridia bacterium]
MYQKYGYLDFVDYSSFLKNKYEPVLGAEYTKDAAYKADKDAIQDENAYLENASVQEFSDFYEHKGYTITYLTPDRSKSGKVKSGGNGYLLAVRELPVYGRVWNYFTHLISIETTRDVTDPELTERYIRVEKDPYSGFYALVGSGTTHKYLLYVDGRFPFLHQNFIHLNLGTSYTKYRGQEITQVINRPTGDQVKATTQYPAQIGTDQYIESAIDFHTLTYNYNPRTKTEMNQFPDQYTAHTYRFSGLSMLENSFVAGIIATIIAYLLGLPLGIAMARHKEGLLDKIGNGYIIFIMAVPSLAYIFLFATVGTTLFGLPYKFANAEVKIFAYFLPIISLALPQVGSLMKWMRRYMIDQMNSDYVKFARAEGLSEREIFAKHISRNAMIPLIHGIPGNILGCLTGAIITERVYAMPGVGNLLTAAINGHDNGIIVACTMFYTSLSIISIILGDLLMAKFDPRISLTASKGGGR